MAGDPSIAPPVVADHSGLQTRVAPVQLAVPAASNAAQVRDRPNPTKTVEPPTAGEEVIAPPVGAVHSGAQTFGDPEQPVTPAASVAYRSPSVEPTYTTPLATAGDAAIAPPVAIVQLGAHTDGVPEQPVPPAVSNAERRPSAAPT